jgi:thiamine biosynthesis lipoprotein
MREARQTRVQMDMPVTVAIPNGTDEDLAAVFDLFAAVDARFSTYKDSSEVSRLNRGEITKRDISPELREVLRLCAATHQETDGFFDIHLADGTIDPSGLVKGWAIHRAADLLRSRGRVDFFIDAGGDIELSGRNDAGRGWRVGLRSPWNREEITAVVTLPNGGGVATSGEYVRGDHIYNPRGAVDPHWASLTVIGPDAYEADRFVTAAFAMGKDGLDFIEQQPGLEAYALTTKKTPVETSGFGQYTQVAA